MNSKQLFSKWLITVTFGMHASATLAAPQLGLFPQTSIYPVYIADPLRPTFNAQNQFYARSTIANTSKN